MLTSLIIAARESLQAIKPPSSAHIQAMLFALGFLLIASGISLDAIAYDQQAVYNDDRVAESADILLTHINGAFGALVMVACGLGAILSSAFGQYRSAVGLLVVAIGAFILRSLVGTWFNDVSLQANTVR